MRGITYMVNLIGDERLDYLLADQSMKIIQSPTAFSFSLDAVLLAHFANIPIQKGNILDLCTGNGVIPLLLSKRTKEIGRASCRERVKKSAGNGVYKTKGDDIGQVEQARFNR